MIQDFNLNNILDEALENGSFYQDPYPIYRILRLNAPIIWSSNKEGYYVTTYNHIEYIMKRYPLYKKATSSINSIRDLGIRSHLLEFITRWPFYRNDDYQDQKSRTQQLINQNTNKINDLVHQFILPRPLCNLVDSIFIPIALLSILRVMDVDQREFPYIKQHSKFILQLMQNDLEASDEPHLADSIQYFEALYARYDHKDIVEYGMFCNLLIDGYEPLAQALTFSTLMYIEHRPTTTFAALLPTYSVKTFVKNDLHSYRVLK